jgi:DNA-binding winged helix-turn-helix (wHTH) protein
MNCHFTHKIFFENDAISLVNNRLLLKANGRKVVLSKNQMKLFICLINEVNDKNHIMENIWPGTKAKSKENNYTQLLFQTKAVLTRGGFPEDTVITMPKYGVCLNMNLLRPLPKDAPQREELFSDQGMFNYDIRT